MRNKKASKHRIYSVMLLIVLSLSFAALLVKPAQADIFDSIGNVFSVTTDTAASGSVSIYDTYAEFIDFLIFTVIFVASVHIALSKVWGDDFKKAGAGNAIRALTIVLGIAFAIAAIKAGLSVSFFIPFARNLLFFIIIIALYFLLQALGVKNKILAFILAVILAIILFNIGDILISKPSTGKLSLPSLGFGSVKIPDLGGATKVVSEGTSGVGNFFSNLFGTRSKVSNNAELEKQVLELEKRLGDYKERARIECRTQILPTDDYYQALSKLKSNTEDISRWLNSKDVQQKFSQENTSENWAFLRRCEALGDEFGKALLEYQEKLALLGRSPKAKSPDDNAVNSELKSLAGSIRADCRFLGITTTDDYGTLLEKLSKGTLDYRKSISYSKDNKDLPEEYKTIGKCEEYLTRLSMLLGAFPDRKKNDAYPTSECKVELPKGISDEEAFLLVNKEVVYMEYYISTHPEENTPQYRLALEACRNLREKLNKNKQESKPVGQGKYTLEELERMRKEAYSKARIPCGIYTPESKDIDSAISSIETRLTIISEEKNKAQCQEILDELKMIRAEMKNPKTGGDSQSKVDLKIDIKNTEALADKCKVKIDLTDLAKSKDAVITQKTSAEKDLEQAPQDKTKVYQQQVQACGQLYDSLTQAEVYSDSLSSVPQSLIKIDLKGTQDLAQSCNVQLNAKDISKSRQETQKQIDLLSKPDSSGAPPDHTAVHKKQIDACNALLRHLDEQGKDTSLEDDGSSAKCKVDIKGKSTEEAIKIVEQEVKQFEIFFATRPEHKNVEYNLKLQQACINLLNELKAKSKPDKIKDTIKPGKDPHIKKDGSEPNFEFDDELCLPESQWGIVQELPVDRKLDALARYRDSSALNACPQIA